MLKQFFPFLLIIFLNLGAAAQSSGTNNLWHGIERSLRYHPEGNDIVIVNGERRFTRALYGTNTAFRVEAGDLPEFAMYMPGMGGNLKFGIINGDNSKWLIKADKITARYRPGSMLYEIEDAMLGRGKIFLSVLAMADEDGMIIKLETKNISGSVKLVWAFGGATGKKFSRDGDMGPDPESSFYLKPEYCTDNNFQITANSFLLRYGTGLLTEADPYVNKNFPDTTKPQRIGKESQLTGWIPPSSDIHIANAQRQDTPLQLYQSEKSNTPLVTGSLTLINSPFYFAFRKQPTEKNLSYAMLPAQFNQAEIARKKIANRITIKTPDSFLNTLGGVLSIAADAVWESPTFLHGAIGWRMRLNGWRGPYVGDVLGWHNRAKTHFKAYALSQVTTPLSGPVVMDTALHLARSLEKMGTSVYSSGYISRNPNGDFRPHHYDMNLVFIDALFRHFYWTGDLAFAKEMWPVIKRHLAWEKRNFDSDDDGLYDAYAAIWASDALEYSGGSVTHSSAYNYKANKDAAIIAKLIGEDPKPFDEEATKILRAINATLWVPSMGCYAEFKDLLGNKLLHTNPAVWTIYHALDSDVADPFQAYQSIQYISENIPKIPVRAKGIGEGYHTISTSNWMPYDWSINNVATAEVMHTALAAWQAGQSEKAFTLFKSELLSTMYLGGSAGNIGQISFYDAARGEAYRDFADPVAMTARSLVEGLFGILPNALKKELVIKPGFPATWNNASIRLPDISIGFKRKGKEDHYTIIPAFANKMKLKLLLIANGTTIQSITVNGKISEWKNINESVGGPQIIIEAGIQQRYEIKIVWQGNKKEPAGLRDYYINDGKLNITFPGALIQSIQDPQNSLRLIEFKDAKLKAVINSGKGSKTIFVKLKQNKFSWWQPIHLHIRDAVEITAPYQQIRNSLRFTIRNNTDSLIKGEIIVNKGAKAFRRPLDVKARKEHIQLNVAPEHIIAGSNEVYFSWGDMEVIEPVINWNVDQLTKNAQAMDISHSFNDKVTSIFRNQYLSPRPTGPTLQLPTQGIGDWTHPLKTADINDSGLRKRAVDNRIVLPQGIPFFTPADPTQKNILFVSQWDNYSKEAIVPLTGSASHIYLLMAGSTNPMQSRMVNGRVIISYMDNSADTLELKNPENWWPIEQDYMHDGFAFNLDAPRPVRVHLKSGKIVSEYDESIVAYNGKMIEGGAATVLDLPLHSDKQLKEFKLQAVTNDVVIGLMAITLIR